YTEVAFPVGAEIEIDGWHQLLLLIVEGVQAGDGPQGAVVFDPGLDSLHHPVSDLEVRRELHTLPHGGTMQGTVEGWIEAEIPAFELFIDDGPDFPSPCVFRK